MVKQEVVIGHLYPIEMNIYGDNGNVLVLKKRLEWRGYAVKVEHIGLGDTVPKTIDILVSGGGQDAGQLKVQDDLLSKADSLRNFAQDGMVMLVICGTYQLFGKRFITNRDKVIPGIDLFDMETRASTDRLIGNVVAESTWGTLVGYENHSGRTFLGGGLQPLARVVKGAGNNGEDATEGAVFKNVFGSYLHGPILPKNPQLADELIKRALVRKYGKVDLQPLDDTFANRAAEVAKNRPR